MNKQIDEATIVNIIKPYTTFAKPINQYDIAKEYEEKRYIKIAPRTVRKVIEGLIEQGYPIISTSREPGGYAWRGAEGEALACYKQLRRKAIKEMLRARWTLRNSRIGQLRLMEV